MLLDVHQDAVGTAVCSEGVPMWFSKQYTPHLIGAPIWPLPELEDGTCGRNDTDGWAEYAGDVDYNIKNRCCRKRNQGSWGSLITTRSKMLVFCSPLMMGSKISNFRH